MEENLNKEAASEYYDSVFASSMYDVPWESYKHRDIYIEAMKHFRGDENVIEIGCGTGQFAHCLFMNNKCNSYKGFDFSDVAIHKTRILNKFNTQAWIFKADVYGVIRNMDMFFKKVDTVVAFEVLEHIKDKPVLKAISEYKKGIKIVASLPTFDDKSHIRFFKTEAEIRRYYNGIINILYIKKISAWYLFVGEIL